MGTKLESNVVVEKCKYTNNLDKSYGFLCLSIFQYLLFHLSGLKTPKQVWKQIDNLFGKKHELSVYQLENQLISINPRNFETINVFFTEFKHLVL